MKRPGKNHPVWTELAAWRTGKWSLEDSHEKARKVLEEEGIDMEQVARPGNGFAVTALILGLVGAVFGLIPLTAVIALITGILALIFGIVGWRRAKQGAEHKGMAIAGFVLGIVAIVLAVVGFVIIDEALTELERDLEKLDI